jgi:cholesterol oxidase
MASFGYDLIVVGSGFGGAVAACRAAQTGARVLVLERGRRWTPDSYPRALSDAWLYDHNRPQHKNGWLDVRFFRGMGVALGAGVGGGSLCYSSVVLEANTETFGIGWPTEITRTELDPYYARVAKMLDVRPIPPGQVTQRHKLLREAAAKIGLEDRYFSTPLAVSFDPDWNYDLPDAIDKRHTKAFVNAHGRWQGTCVHLGNCDVGCDVQAKNTLDLNYIAAAERLGADVRPLHVVRSVEPARGGYRVTFDAIDGRRLRPGSETSARVVLAAGSLGTTELLLRSRDEFRTLPRLSPALGTCWSANANVLTPALYNDPARVRQSIGPTISAGIDLMDGKIDAEQFVIEDDGFPNLLLNALSQCAWPGWVAQFGSFPAAGLRRAIDEKDPLAHVMVWLGAGLDGSDGRLGLKRSWRKPWRRKLSLDWKLKNSRLVIEAILKIHRQLSEVTSGRVRVPLYWRWLRSLVTVHPLGGCRMGTSADTAVVDHRGEVFGYPKLYVADGAIIPRAIGKNPSMTIAALSERIAELMWRE